MYAGDQGVAGAFDIFGANAADQYGEIFSDYTPAELRILRHACTSSHMAFYRTMYRAREGVRAKLNLHLYEVAEALEATYRGEISRLIINIPPGYFKTEMSVIQYVARGLAINPRAKFIHTSYSKDLALDNAQKTRDIIELPIYRRLWPQTIRHDAKAKSKWYNDLGGGMYSAAAGGQLTGFRAGRMESGPPGPYASFTGAVIIDDPLKPDDAASDTKREAVNARLTNTIKSRLAREDVPIIIIMQRLHDNDLTGFALGGGTGDKWYHLEIPVDVPTDRPYPAEYKAGIQLKHDLEPGPLWKAKHDEKQIEQLRIDPYTYSAQYDQRPAPLGGAIFRTDWFKYYDKFDAAKSLVTWIDRDTGREESTALSYKMIYADTAQKTKEANDWSVFQLWAKGRDGRIYLLDQARGKWESPDLRRKFLRFCTKHDFEHKRIGMGVRARKVEDKASGTGLIQDINREVMATRGADWITGIPRDTDKVSRARSGAPQIAEGLVVLPGAVYWLPDYLYEFSRFNGRMTHKHDDQIDPTLDAIHDMLIADAFVPYGAMLN